MSVLSASSIRSLALAALCSVSLGGFSRLQADSVSSIVTTTTTGTGSTSNGYGNKTLVWDSQSTSITSFTSSSGLTYSYSNIFGSMSVNFDYNSTTANKTSSVYEQLVSTSGSTYTFFGSQPSGSMGSVLTSTSTTAAVANPFNNGNNSANIERIDVYFGSSYTVSASDAIVIYCLTASSTDSFKVLAFQSSSSSTVSSYVGTVYTATTSGSSLGTSDYTLLTYGSADSLSGTAAVSSTTTTLTLVGVVIKLSDLGLQAGDTISGISLFASDVVTSDYSQLLNLSSSAYQNSTSSSVSFLGFGGVTESNVPEASTYGLVFSGLGLASYGAMRLRRRQLLVR